MVDVQTYLALNNGSKEAYFLLGRINQGKMNFEKAAKAFEKAQGWGVPKTDTGNADTVYCPTAMEISKNAWSTCTATHNDSLAPDDRLDIYLSLGKNILMEPKSLQTLPGQTCLLLF